jgi:hypothetical protein
MKVRIGTGALLGVLVVVIWWVNRSDVVPFDPTLGLVLIGLMFVAAGFVGALRSNSFAGGISSGFAAGCIGALTVPGDYLFFRIFPFYDPASFALTMAASVAVVMFLATVGAGLATSAVRRRLLPSTGGGR